MLRGFQNSRSVRRYFQMKNLLIIYPHWPPSNLAGVHRPRLIANYLEDFGWHPVVLTVKPEYYEEKPDWDLCQTVSENVEVHYAGAFKITKPRIIGDIGLRAFWQLYKAAKKIIKQRKIDFVWIPIPSFYTALIGRLLYEKTKVPYGIDYIDPWVRDITGRRDWRHVLSNALAKVMEPIAIKKAALITGVAEEYYMPALLRNFKKEEIKSGGEASGEKEDPESEQVLKGDTGSQQINKSTNQPIFHLPFPYGFDPNDYNIALKNLEYPWKDIPDCKPLVYAGAFLPNSRIFIQSLFQAIRQLINNKEWDERCHLFFLGTGSYSGKSIMDYAKESSIENYVHEIRDRFPYLSILNFLSAAFAVLVIGSTEKHYTASKTYQAILSKRPVIAVLHGESSAVYAMDGFNAAKYLIKYKDEMTVEDVKDEFIRKLATIFSTNTNDWRINIKSIEKWSSKNGARRLSQKIEACCLK